MIRPEFAVHRLNEIGLVRAALIADDFSTLLTNLEARGLAGRDLALVKTKLEWACFVAKRSMASVAENQAAP